MLDTIWNWAVFPWSHKEIVGVIALAIGVFTWLWRFMDAKPRPFLFALLYGGGFFLVVVGWAVIVAILLIIAIAFASWWKRENDYMRRIWYPERRKWPDKGPDLQPVKATLPDVETCEVGLCAACSERAACRRSFPVTIQGG